MMHVSRLSLLLALVVFVAVVGAATVNPPASVTTFYNWQPAFANGNLTVHSFWPQNETQFLFIAEYNINSVRHQQMQFLQVGNGSSTVTALGTLYPTADSTMLGTLSTPYNASISLFAERTPLSSTSDQATVAFSALNPITGLVTPLFEFNDTTAEFIFLSNGQRIANETDGSAQYSYIANLPAQIELRTVTVSDGTITYPTMIALINAGGSVKIVVYNTFYTNAITWKYVLVPVVLNATTMVPLSAGPTCGDIYFDPSGNVIYTVVDMTSVQAKTGINLAQNTWPTSLTTGAVLIVVSLTTQLPLFSVILSQPGQIATSVLARSMVFYGGVVSVMTGYVDNQNRTGTQYYRLTLNNGFTGITSTEHGYILTYPPYLDNCCFMLKNRPLSDANALAYLDPSGFVVGGDTEFQDNYKSLIEYVSWTPSGDYSTVQIWGQDGAVSSVASLKNYFSPSLKNSVFGVGISTSSTSGSVAFFQVSTSVLDLLNVPATCYDYSFLNSSNPIGVNNPIFPSQCTAGPPSKPEPPLSGGAVAGIIIGVVLAVVLLVFAGFYAYRQYQIRKDINPEERKPLHEEANPL